MAWRRFVFQLVAVFLGGSLALFALLALLDPWGALGSPVPTIPADHSQRWAYPELARDKRFDAAIIGNSGSRLLNPADLDPATDARFVNLSMVRAYAYEQARLLDVFLDAHPRPRAVLIGLDRVWCERDAEQFLFGYEPIPEWLYDGDLGAALGNLLNLHAIETAWRSLSAELGLSARPYGRNGYALIDVDRHRYDPALAHSLIAKDLTDLWPEPITPEPATWRYPALDRLTQRLDRLPPETRKLLVFVPRYHLYPAPGSVGAAMMDECKRRVVRIARARPNAQVFDLAFPNALTSDDSLWWDAVHMRPEPLAQVSQDLAAAIEGQERPDVRRLDAGASGGVASAADAPKLGP